jgi:surface protein
LDHKKALQKQRNDKNHFEIGKEPDDSPPSFEIRVSIDHNLGLNTPQATALPIIMKESIGFLDQDTELTLNRHLLQGIRVVLPIGANSNRGDEQHSSAGSSSNSGGGGDSSSSSAHSSHSSVFDNSGERMVCVVGLVFLYFVAPSLAVFQWATAFNQDVSKWNTGAVTRMDESKCTLCLLLCF